MVKIKGKSLVVDLILLLGIFNVYGDSLSATSVDQLPGIIADARGKSTVVMIFSSGCPLSRNLWPKLLELAKKEQNNNVAFPVFSVDKSQDKAVDFVSNYTTPFSCYWVAPWEPGRLDASMGPIGIRIGQTLRLPLVAVINPEGQVIAQWQGLQDISQVAKALGSAETSTAPGSN